MARLRRCDELITEFRMRLGEPTAGTFGTVYYDGIRDNVDEIRSILNQAQEHVTWMCYSANQALLEKTTYIVVLNGVTRYTLPDDFLAPVSVFHRTYSQEYEVTRENLFLIRASTRTLRHDYRFKYYEIRENVPLISARGVMEQDSLNRIKSDGLGSVRLGDTCYNLTDNSQGIIEAVYPGIQTVQVDLLGGGNTNRFQIGDNYQIDMKEATRDAIDFWPAVDRADSRTVHTGTPTDWQINEDAIILGINTNFTLLSSLYEEDDRFTLQISETDGGRIIAEAGKEGLTDGTNVFGFPRPLQLREDTRYRVRVHSPQYRVRVQSPDTVLTPDSIDVTAQTPEESVEIRYSHLPRRMEKATDYCEMPSWSINGVYAYGHIIAQKKQSRNPNADPGLMIEFKEEMASIKKFIFARDERGPHAVPTVAGNRAGGNWPYPSNWGYSAVDVFDLL